MVRLAGWLAAPVLAGALSGSAIAQESWVVRLDLQDAQIEPPAVQVALVEADPLPGFRARLAAMKEWHAGELARKESDEERALWRATFLTVNWNLVFEDVPGSRLHLLTGPMTLSSNRRPGRRWVVTKTRPVEGRPACWCLPVETAFGAPIEVVLTTENRFDLDAVYEEVMGTGGAPPAPPPAEPAPAPAPDRADASEPALDELDLARIGELYRLTDAFGEEIWPGFDARAIPVAINLEDRHELLVGHPAPPPEYRSFEGREIGGLAVLIREGVSRFGPKGGGWAVDLGGERAVYVGRKRAGSPTEGYLSLMLHEAFHVHQNGYRERAAGRGAEPPIDDPRYSALLSLESRLLSAFLAEPEAEDARELARMFVAVRHERRQGLSEEVVRQEGEQEYNEGTATYAQARTMELLVEAGGLPGSEMEDPDYAEFAGAQKELEELLSAVLPAPGTHVTFFHSMYRHGMAQGLVLDRLREGWKEEMREKGMTQFGLLERALPLDEVEERELVAAAQERFGYEELLAEQERLIAEQIELVRGYLEAPGRRYRIHHEGVLGRFRWKPEGPVHHVPASLAGDDRMLRDATVWVGGIRRFERGHLVFESQAVPMIFRHDYAEWIDPEPAPDGSDLVIRSKRRDGDVFEGLELETDGFTLSADRARVEVGEDVVDIVALPAAAEPEEGAGESAADALEHALALSLRWAESDREGVWSDDRVTFDQERPFAIALENRSRAPVTLVRPGDGSDCGWRTPLVGWSVLAADDEEAAHPPEPPPAGGARCGNVNALKPDEVTELGPGEVLELGAWCSAPVFPGPGRYRVVFYYANAPETEWVGLPLGAHDPDAMRRVRSSTPCALVSNEVLVTIAE